MNSRQAKFAEAYLEGMPAGRAYEFAGYEARDGEADAAASRLLRNAKVAAYIEKRQAELAEKCDIKKEQILKILMDTVMTPPAKVDGHHMLCQSYERTSGESAKGGSWEKEKFVMVGKMPALQEINKMLGFYAKAEAEVTHLGFEEALEAIVKSRDKVRDDDDD